MLLVDLYYKTALELPFTVEITLGHKLFWRDLPIILGLKCYSLLCFLYL